MKVMNYDELRREGEEYIFKNGIIKDLNNFRNDPDNGCQEEIAKEHSHRRQVDAHEVAIAIAITIRQLRQLKHKDKITKCNVPSFRIDGVITSKKLLEMGITDENYYCNGNLISEPYNDSLMGESIKWTCKTCGMWNFTERKENND